jgi:5-methylcytosine-specific restriction endonuclease McrA
VNPNFVPSGHEVRFKKRHRERLRTFKHKRGTLPTPEKANPATQKQARQRRDVGPRSGKPFVFIYRRTIACCYERELITYEKMEHLLRLAGLTPEAMGIKQEKSYMPPTDDELDKIMGE